MLKRIILHGHLAEKHSEIVSVEAETIAEALQALTQFTDLTPPPGEPWPIRIEGVEKVEDLYAVTPIREIHIYPQTGGAGGGRGLFQIVIGITMIALAVVNPTWMPAMLSRGSLFLSGAMMVTGGILQMLAPMPPAADGDSAQSSIAGGVANTTRIGTAIPLAYGTQSLAGHYLSFDVDAADWNGTDDEEEDGLLKRHISKVTNFPSQSTEAGLYSLPGASNSEGPDQGVYVEFDKPDVPYAIVNPVFTSQQTGPGNIPQSSWIV